MPRINSSNWSVNDAITAARLHDLNEDLDDIYVYGDDRGRVRTAISGTALRIDIAAFAYRIGQNSGQFAGATDTVVTNTATNYVEVDDAGAIQINTSDWTVGGARARLATVTCSGGVVTAISLWKPDLVGGTLGASATIDQSNKTAAYTVLSSDSNKLLTSIGASDLVRFTLPTPVVGEHYMIVVGAAQLVQIIRGNTSTHSLYYGENLIKGLSGASIGLSVHLYAISTTQWVVKDIVGTWYSTTGAGYIFGGTNGTRTNIIQKLLYSTEARTTITATLTAAANNVNGCSGLSGGYGMGSYDGSYQTNIQKLAWAIETRTTISATLDTADAGKCVQSQTKGYLMGGNNGNLSRIEDMNFSTETSAAIAATLPAARSEGNCITAEWTAGYYGGGSSSSAIYKLTYSGETTSTLSATVSGSNYNSMSGNVQNGSTAGYWAGGDGPSNTIRKLTYSGETTSSLGATLDTAERGMTGVTNASTKGFYLGGADISGNYYSTINDLTFSGETSVQIAASLAATNAFTAGCMDQQF